MKLTGFTFFVFFVFTTCSLLLISVYRKDAVIVAVAEPSMSGAKVNFYGIDTRDDWPEKNTTIANLPLIGFDDDIERSGKVVKWFTVGAILIFIVLINFVLVVARFIGHVKHLRRINEQCPLLFLIVSPFAYCLIGSLVISSSHDDSSALITFLEGFKEAVLGGIMIAFYYLIHGYYENLNEGKDIAELLSGHRVHVSCWTRYILCGPGFLQPTNTCRIRTYLWIYLLITLIAIALRLLYTFSFAMEVLSFLVMLYLKTLAHHLLDAFTGSLFDDLVTYASVYYYISTVIYMFSHPGDILAIGMLFDMVDKQEVVNAEYCMMILMSIAMAARQHFLFKVSPYQVADLESELSRLESGIHSKIG